MSDLNNTDSQKYLVAIEAAQDAKKLIDTGVYEAIEPAKVLHNMALHMANRIVSFDIRNAAIKKIEEIMHGAFQ